jgi:curved DNA-binding protein CbpA
MTDYFALLQQPRQAWLDLNALKEAYLELSKQVHPDKSSQAEGVSAEINAAYQCLRTPRTRVLHLIELETGKHPEAVQAIPPELSDFFMQMTRIVRETDAFLRQWSAATGLVKAQMFEAAQQWVEKLQAVQGEINARVAGAESELAPSKCPTLPGLLNIYHLLSYYGRWSDQIQERLARLAT